MGWDAIGTHIQRAPIHVIGHVRGIIEGDVDTLGANMKFAIPNRLGEVRRGLTIQRSKCARTHARIAGIFGARIVVVARHAHAALDVADPDDALANRRAYSARSVIGYWRVARISSVATIFRALFVVIGEIGVIVCRNNFAIKAIIASTIARGLLGQWAIGHIRNRARPVGSTRIDRARILIVAICIGGTDVSLFGRLSSIGFECARGNLRGCSSKGKNSDNSGEKARTKRHW